MPSAKGGSLPEGDIPKRAYIIHYYTFCKSILHYFPVEIENTGNAEHKPFPGGGEIWGIICRMRKIRVFELAKSKDISINRAVELLAGKGIADASAITYVDANILDDLPDARARESTAAPVAPEAAPTAEEARNTSAVLAQRLSRREYGPEPSAGRRDGTVGNMNALLAVVLSIVTLGLTAFVFLSERDDRTELRQVVADVAAIKASSEKVEEIVVNNRAQIMEMRDQVSGMEKRIYEFKRSSLLAQIKSQGVVLRALAENLQEPLKGKALSLSTHLSQF